MIVPIKVCDEEFSIEIFDHDETVSNIIREQTIYSINDLKQFKKFLNKGDYFVDAGANLGWHTLFAAKAVGDTGKVFAFEPVKKIFDLLALNIKLNHLDNSVAVHSALTNYTGSGELARSSKNFGDNMVCHGDTEQKLKNWYGHEDHIKSDREQINCTTLDNYIKSNDIDACKIKLIKMDIQGSEPHALEGMKDLIKQCHPAIILEFSPMHMKICDTSPFDILAFMDKNDYIPYHIREQRDIPDDMILYNTSIMDLIKVTQELFTSGTYNGFDLLLVHRGIK